MAFCMVTEKSSIKYANMLFQIIFLVSAAFLIEFSRNCKTSNKCGHWHGLEDNRDRAESIREHSCAILLVFSWKCFLAILPCCQATSLDTALSNCPWRALVSGLVMDTTSNTWGKAESMNLITVRSRIWRSFGSAIRKQSLSSRLVQKPQYCKAYCNPCSLTRLEGKTWVLD